jgi:hypothetical protein
MDNLIINVVLGMLIYQIIDLSIYLIKSTPKNEDKKPV